MTTYLDVKDVFRSWILGDWCCVVFDGSVRC